jgi:hypothetical protein
MRADMTAGEWKAGPESFAVEELIDFLKAHSN